MTTNEQTRSSQQLGDSSNSLPTYLKEQSKLYRLQKARDLSSSNGLSTLWKPFHGKPQEAAYNCTADVIGMGGAAGGGKTDLGLGKAFTQFYNAIIFRREFVQLKNVITRGDAIQEGRCRFIAGLKMRWTTSDNRYVELGAVQHESSVNDYKGRPHDFIHFDETADFSEYQVRFLSGWLRTDRPNIKPQILMTFNPPTTPEGEWVIKFFAPWLDPNYQGRKAQPGEFRYFIRHKDEDIEVESGEPITIEDVIFYPQSRTFFPAYVDDNPTYMATGYDKQLESLPEPLRSQLRYGDFTVSAKDDIWQAIPTAWIIEAQNRWLQMEKPDLKLRSVGVDPSRGGGDETVISKLYGTWFDELIIYPGRNVPDGIIGARYVTDAIGQEQAPISVDVIGYGASVYDHLKVLPNVKAYPINVGEGSRSTDKTGRYGFANLRAEVVWKFREALDPTSGEHIALPPDYQLRQDLRAARYSIVGGKIKIELKDEIKKRIGRSPDRGEAVLLAWHGVTVPKWVIELW